ncbi:granulocyte-macrophage colony-stimulating factor [Tenrec ecaudatus]|uniref:granulocyte-macrophage colony-stimulating factor n=1 Tax=Tenrec ecaudatus TaxID=94439 RepID=UPI003F5A2862
MWLQNLLLLVTVACSISAPTRGPVTLPHNFNDGLAEALRILDANNDAGAATETFTVVSGMLNPQKLECLRTRVQLYKQGLRGSLTNLEGLLEAIHKIFNTSCPAIPETACDLETITFEAFKENLKIFLSNIPLGCPGQAQQ